MGHAPGIEAATGGGETTAASAVEAAAAGRTSYGKGAALPCPACGYDLRAAPASEGWVRCPECGERSKRAAIEAASRRPRVLLAAVGLWIFGLPVIYLFGIGLGAVVLQALEVTPAVWWAVLILVAFMMTSINWPMVTRINHRFYGAAVSDRGARTTAFWLTLGMLDVMHAGLIFVYALSGFCGLISIGILREGIGG